MQIVVDGLLTNYELQGKGSLVVLLHGWGDSLKGLAGLQKSLISNYQVLAVDLPGFGASQVPPKAWNLDDYASFIAATLTKLGVKAPLALIGHSNGGAVAIRSISLGLLKPQKLILLAAAGIRNKQSARKLALQVVAKTGKVASAVLPRQQQRRLRQKLYQAAGSDLLVVPGMEETFKRTVSQDVQADASKLDLPTLLIYGLQDESVPISYGRRYHQLIKASRLEELPAGHFLHLDQPSAVTELIEEFLA